MNKMTDIKRINELGTEIELKWVEISKLSFTINENLNKAQ
jgi:hypothetical protein